MKRKNEKKKISVKKKISAKKKTDVLIRFFRIDLMCFHVCSYKIDDVGIA